MDLRGASAESLRELAVELDEALSGGADAERVARELYNVSTLLRGEPALRRFATDASLPANAKQGLIQQVFADKLGDATLALVTSAAGRRWTATRDLATTLAGRIVGESLDDQARQTRVVDRFLTELEGAN